MCCRGEGRFVGWTGFPFLVRPWTSLGYLSVSTSLSAAFRSIFRRGRPLLFPWAGFVFHDVSPLPSFRASQILPWEGRRGRAIQPSDDLLGLCLIRSSPLPPSTGSFFSPLLLPRGSSGCSSPSPTQQGGGVNPVVNKGRGCWPRGKEDLARGWPRYPYLRLHRPPLQRTRPWIRHGRTRRHPRPLRTHVPGQTSSWKPAAGETCRTRGRTRRKDGRRTPRTGTGETPRNVDVQCEAWKGWNVKNVVLTRCEGRCTMRGSDPTIDTTD